MNRRIETALRSKYNFRKHCTRRKRTSCMLRAILCFVSVWFSSKQKIHRYKTEKKCVISKKKFEMFRTYHKRKMCFQKRDQLKSSLNANTFKVIRNITSDIWSLKYKVSITRTVIKVWAFTLKAYVCHIKRQKAKYVSFQPLLSV
jgi:hypothetical protein